MKIIKTSYKGIPIDVEYREESECWRSTSPVPKGVKLESRIEGLLAESVVSDQDSLKKMKYYIDYLLNKNEKKLVKK